MNLENDEWFDQKMKEYDERCSSASNPGGASLLPKEGDSLFDPPTSTVTEKPCLDAFVEGVISSPTFGLFPPVSNIRSTKWTGSGRGSFRGGGSTRWTGSGRGRR